MKLSLKNFIFYCIFFIFHDSNTFANSKSIKIHSKEFQMNLLNNCFKNPSETRVVVLNWTNYRQDNFYLMNSQPIVLFGIEKTDNLETYESRQQLYYIYTDDTILRIQPLPAKLIIIEELNIEAFKLILYKLKDSAFWSIHTLIVIKHIETSDNCKNAYAFLKLSWDFNILSAVYLCRNLNFRVNLLTLNPYSKMSSKFWKENATYNQGNGELFTLFVNSNELVESSTMCEEIWFDKTLNLSEYPVRIAISNLTYKSIVDETIGTFIEIEAYKTGRQYMSIIWKKLNTRSYSIEYFLEEDFGEIDDEGVASGMIGEVLQGKYEALGSEDYQRGLWKLEVNTFLRSGLCFIIKKVYLSINEQLVLVFPVRMQVILLAIFIIISLLFMYMLKKNYVTVIMDIIRIFIGASMIHESSFLFGKIIIWFIFAFMILNSFLQSQLSALLLTETFHNDVERDIYDLINMGYDIYMNRVIEEAYRQISFNDSDHFFDNVLECLQLMKTNDMVACIEDCTLIKYVLQKSKDINILYDKDYDRNDVLVMRDETPLHHRVEEIYNRLFEHGIISYITDLDKLYFKRSAVTEVSGLSMKRLKYSIYFLLIGHTIGIIVFFFEIGRFKIKNLLFHMQLFQTLI